MTSAILGFLWIILVSLVALIPFPQHKPYALALLILFPVLLVMIAIDFGILWALGFFLGALSIYRYPAMFLAHWLRRKLTGGGGA